jgi:hypothetical protein
MSEEQTTMRVLCAACGHQTRNHNILYEKNLDIYSDENEPPEVIEHHRLVQCLGCETIKYMVSKSDWFTDPEVPPWENQETDLKIYPAAPGPTEHRVPMINEDEATDDEGKLLIPPSVWKMYKETIDALNSNIRTLAGGGLRATVEGICLDNGITAGNLQNKIDELANRGLLTTAQADLLHEERYLGNSALHELSTPSAQDIQDGLGIVEGLINTIYVLPAKAKRLKERREAKKSQRGAKGLEIFKR